MSLRRSYVTPLLVFVSLSLSACSSNTSDLSENIDAQLSDNRSSHGIPAQALVVMHNQNVLYRNSIGVKDLDSATSVDNQTVFPIYSVSKLFASTLIMTLEQQGALSLSDPISKHIDALPANWGNIRIDQLLNHASGLPEYFSCEQAGCVFPTSIESAITKLDGVETQFEAGTQLQYNQTNYLLLKLIIERVTGADYRSVVESNIFKPLQMENTWLGHKHVPKHRLVTAYLANSGSKLQINPVRFPDYAISQADAFSTIDDLSRFLSALAQGKLVSQQQLIKLWQPFELQDGSLGYFASGWDYDQTGDWLELGHDGGGLVRVRILFQEDLSDHYVFVYLTNGNQDGVWSRTLVDSVQYYVLPDWYSRIATLL